MSAKPLIPTPPGQHLRYARVHLLPTMVFLGMLLAVGWIWQKHILPVSLVGRIETEQADVSSPRAGIVANLGVERFKPVEKDQVVAEIVTTDESVLKASLALIKAELDVIQAGLITPLDNPQRNAINYEQLRAEWMRQRVDLATAQINHQLAQTELDRTQRLFLEKIVSQADLDSAKNRESALATEVIERTKLVETSGQSVERLQPAQGTNNTRKQIEAIIQQEDAKLKLTEAQLCPIALKAPISGLVSFVHRRSGEAVGIGDPIVTISATQTPAIVGFLRQPLYAEPQTNMAVLVRTRGLKRLEGTGHILAVGAQLQPLDDIYLPPQKNPGTELGLPIRVSMPTSFKAQAGANLMVHPGELVDLTILPKRP
jgi:multidrug resistance efflux pump